ncbi:hypothetical protein GCM10009765_48070 [Fodinicola feengrottensis]|uniref:YqeG family HAD IIIA-type phosphatase n=1 Tax=Fodinicola feengrottensis TaxID=435914 RepID=A0ABN2HT70_9ACTN
MKVDCHRLTEPIASLQRVVDLAPRTVIFDVEPLVAYWDTDEAALRAGVKSALEAMATMPTALTVCFATNSRRRLTVAPAHPGISVSYVASAFKPFRTALFRGLPRPGVVVGDQIATDGVLAWRLGFTFIHYRPILAAAPVGPKIMNGLGQAFRPFLFTAKG